jgi:putative ABC transport system ATP-binding protein
VHNVELRAVTLGFGSGAARMTALNGIDLILKPGLFTVISGPSGSGKTSLISILGAMLAPDSGSVLVEDRDITKLAPDRRSAFRREKVGYIFQSFRLMPALNAEENIRLSLELRPPRDGNAPWPRWTW